MSKFSKRQKAIFFEEINQIANYVLNGAKTMPMSEVLDALSGINRPYLYGQVKWVAKTITGQFPTHEQILKAADSNSTYNNWIAEERRAEAFYR